MLSLGPCQGGLIGRRVDIKQGGAGFHRVALAEMHGSELAGYLSGNVHVTARINPGGESAFGLVGLLAGGDHEHFRWRCFGGGRLFTGS